MEKVEPAPIEQTDRGLHLEARMALPDPEPKASTAKNPMIGSVINKEGGLDPVYPTNRSLVNFKLQLLQFEDNLSTEPVVTGSYPKNYPMQQILRALAKDGTRYGNVFAKTIVRRPLEDAGREKEFMCRSKVSQQYPTYDSQTGWYIVNVKGFYQGITYDECDEPGAVCNKDCSSTTSDFRCEQGYDTMDAVIAHVGGNDKEVTLSLVRVPYPSSCKCRRKDLIAKN
ncbi:hypothetical protein AND_002160 [Anopheles darlingi]|uniref:Spaetzle domain-containing protein n=1 Tax=Anopheles darlingi TaxID=43151 RepID=W5JNV2_ANODA|nr:hypothetical protein AND_002160 [Anopheles darlingi]